MLSYRHAFHAGNHADVLKHIVLSLMLDSLKRKDKPFIYIDTHAGAGRYDLTGKWAQQTAEAAAGIQRLWGEQASYPSLSSYFHCIQTLNQASQLRYYPGSPAVASALLRPQDKLTLIELHGNEFTLLQRQFQHDRRVFMQHTDGFVALNALLPPTPRRGMVLIDPPYEDKNDYLKVVDAVAKAHRRWATGSYAIWYPMLSRQRDQSEMMLKKLAQLNLSSLLRIELTVSAQQPDLGMHGSGMAIVNPPWQLDSVMASLLPRLQTTLSADPQARWQLEWLIRDE